MSKKSSKKDNTLIWVLGGLLVVSLFYSVYATVNGSGDVVKSLHKDLIKHEELSMYEDQYPRISYVSEQILANRPPFLIDAVVGDYLIEYQGATVLYRPNKDEIVNLEQILVLPNDFFDKLYGHTQLANFKDLQPNVMIVSKSNLESLKSQVLGLDETYIGDFILNYETFLIIYDYTDDEIKSIIPISRSQEDSGVTGFFDRLNAHAELADVKDETPEVGRLDEATLNQLKEKNPQVYENAEIGDFILRYSNKLVIYDYEQDLIKSLFVVQ